VVVNLNSIFIVFLSRPVITAAAYLTIQVGKVGKRRTVVGYPTLSDEGKLKVQSFRYTFTFSFKDGNSSSNILMICQRTSSCVISFVSLLMSSVMVLKRRVGSPYIVYYDIMKKGVAGFRFNLRNIDTFLRSKREYNCTKVDNFTDWQTHLVECNRVGL